ncbi:MAG: sigma-54 dependent transcriptional regulator, partial [Planctomycetota bacterium]
RQLRTVMANILIADDEEIIRDSLGAILQGCGHTIVVTRDGAAAIKKLSERKFDIVITDMKMPKADGTEVLAAANALESPPPVILITAHGTVETAVQAMKGGAFDFITKPFGADEIEARVDKALAHVGLAREAAGLREIVQGYSRPMIAGASAAMRELASQISRIAKSDATVLIQGESGTGKEVVSRQIHQQSLRADKPFLAVNCAALSAGLLESELFGHKKGAFTGADANRKGRFELADGGTLLLDEVSEIDPNLQAKLLRVLQEREFETVGSSESIKTDVRVLVTTNRDLAERIKEGKFREDLYYRLNVLPLEIPPLRERTEEIPALVEHFMQRHAAALGREVPEISADGMKVLKGYRWSGNVRELENTLERVCVLESADTFDAELLSKYIRGSVAVTGDNPFGEGVPSIATMEQQLITHALKVLSGDRNAIAEALGITTKTLRAKIQKWELE